MNYNNNNKLWNRLWCEYRVILKLGVLSYVWVVKYKQSSFVVVRFSKHIFLGSRKKNNKFSVAARLICRSPYFHLVFFTKESPKWSQNDHYLFLHICLLSQTQFQWHYVWQSIAIRLQITVLRDLIDNLISFVRSISKAINDTSIRWISFYIIEDWYLLFLRSVD